MPNILLLRLSGAETGGKCEGYCAGDSACLSFHRCRSPSGRAGRSAAHGHRESQIAALGCERWIMTIEPVHAPMGFRVSYPARANRRAAHRPPDVWGWSAVAISSRAPPRSWAVVGSWCTGGDETERRPVQRGEKRAASCSRRIWSQQPCSRYVSARGQRYGGHNASRRLPAVGRMLWRATAASATPKGQGLGGRMRTRKRLQLGAFLIRQHYRACKRYWHGSNRLV